MPPRLFFNPSVESPLQSPATSTLKTVVQIQNGFPWFLGCCIKKTRGNSTNQHACTSTCTFDSLSWHWMFEPRNGTRSWSNLQIFATKDWIAGTLAWRELEAAKGGEWFRLDIHLANKGLNHWTTFARALAPIQSRYLDGHLNAAWIQVAKLCWWQLLWEIQLWNCPWKVLKYNKYHAQLAVAKPSFFHLSLAAHIILFPVWSRQAHNRIE